MDSRIRTTLKAFPPSFSGASSAVVHHAGLPEIIVPETGLVRFEAQIQVFGEHEIILTERPDLLENLPSDHQARPRDGFHFNGPQ